MKRTVFVLTIVATFTMQFAFAQQKAAELPKQETKPARVDGPVASYDHTVYDMGEIIYKVPKTATYTLTNKGNEPLAITMAKASCGCTGLQYDAEPILPGKSVTISVTYNAYVLGNFMKTITVRTNASDQPVVLQVKGTVVEAAKKE